MTVEELKDRTRSLEGEIKGLLVDFERRTKCRVVEVRVREEGPEIYDNEVQVVLDPLPYPERRPN